MRADQEIKNALVAGFIGQAQIESCTKHALPFLFQSILSIVITVSFVPARFPERTQKGTLKYCNAGSLTGSNCAHEEAHKKRVDTCQDAAWGRAALFLVAKSGQRRLVMLLVVLLLLVVVVVVIKMMIMNDGY